MFYSPLIDKSVCWSLLWAGLLLAFVVHPYAGLVCWVLALLIAVQELFWVVGLPLLAALAWWGKRGTTGKHH